MNPVKLFFESKAFIISVIILLVYSIFFHNQIIFNQKNIEFVFYLFLALFPLILSVFAILISFTDRDFLVFLKNIKTGGKTVYELIIFYFVLNTFMIFIALLLFGLVLCAELTTIFYLQYLMIFVFIYSIVSFTQLIRFIFYFARKKAEFVDKK